MCLAKTVVEHVLLYKVTQISNDSIYISVETFSGPQFTAKTSKLNINLQLIG